MTALSNDDNDIMRIGDFFLKGKELFFFWQQLSDVVGVISGAG